MTQNRVVSTLGDSSIAGKNVLANGDFRIWDTGTTLSNLQNTDVTFMNGWFMAYNGSFATNVISRQSFTVGNEIPGYEAPYYLRWTTTSPTSNTYAYLGQKVSDVRTFAGQTVTLSGWIKASGSISNNYLQFEQNFGNGGSASIYSSSVGPTITTSWQRISLTATLGSISGKTLGPNSFLKTQIVVAGNQAFTVDTWGWQLEAGSVATSFSSGPSGAAISLDPTNLMTQPGGQGYTSYQVAGKNKIINGDFSIWQRGTSIAVTSNNQTSCDRVNHVQDGSGATRTITKQTFTVNTSGNPTGAVNNQNSYFRYAQSVAGTGGTYNLIEQRIEGAVLAGQMVTFSFWAKAAANLTLPQIDYEFTIGGTNSSANITSNVAVTTSWQRFVYTFIMPTYAGLTPNGINDFFGLRIWLPLNTTFTFDTWGWQLEAGNLATPFSTATGNPQGELAACQRYYQVLGGTASNFIVAGYTAGSQNYRQFISFPVQMRIAPTMAVNGTWAVYNTGQPTAAFISNAGFAFTMTATATGQLFSNPDSSDDTITASAEL